MSREGFDLLLMGGDYFRFVDEGGDEPRMFPENSFGQQGETIIHGPKFTYTGVVEKGAGKGKNLQHGRSGGCVW